MAATLARSTDASLLKARAGRADTEVRRARRWCGGGRTWVATTMMSQTVAQLRERRKDLRRELGLVRWWRELVAARRTLVVAALVHPDRAVPAGLDLSWEALAADAPTAAELSAALWAAADRPTAGTLDALDALDSRLESYEARIAGALDTVTAQMVAAMARGHLS